MKVIIILFTYLLYSIGLGHNAISTVYFYTLYKIYKYTIQLQIDGSSGNLDVMCSVVLLVAQQIAGKTPRRLIKSATGPSGGKLLTLLPPVSEV